MIDRRELVQRHNPSRNAINTSSPMQVGNGCFAFGADITGLQTFAPFAIMSEWGWKHDALPDGYEPEGVRAAVEKDIVSDNDPRLREWLIRNPNRINLGRIGLWFKDPKISEQDLSDYAQNLDLWSGTIHSSMKLQGTSIAVKTACHPNQDAIGFTIESDLLLKGDLSIMLNFPYTDGQLKFSAPHVGFWNRDKDHTTTVLESNESKALLLRQMDDARYFVSVQWSHRGTLERQRGHQFVLKLSHPTSRVEVVATFSQQQIQPPSVHSVFHESSIYWPSFWQSGGAIDLSKSSDSRWFELERRLILAQYVHAVNEAGHDPPQESGLVNLGWYGKFHMEMIFWHLAHYALFNRWNLLQRSLNIYERFIPAAKRLAKYQGYKGGRWPKMTDPSGNSSPGEINMRLIWQQPHPLLFAELDYRAHPSEETLLKWETVIELTADFMSSFPHWDDKSETYWLGPPLHLMSENTDSNETYNPAYELVYWKYGLSLAETWWRRLGRSPKTEWSTVRQHLAPLPTEDGVYIMWADIKDMWKNYNWEHPALIAMYGWLPGYELDLNIMKATSEKLWDTWQLDKCWGWDYGMLAMNAARIGSPEKAVDFLLDKNFRIDDVGLVLGNSFVPAPYFPGTSSLLYAIGFMAAGWDGAPKENAPGFPSNGWTVEHEGLSKAL